MNNTQIPELHTQIKRNQMNNKDITPNQINKHLHSKNKMNNAEILPNTKKNLPNSPMRGVARSEKIAGANVGQRLEIDEKEKAKSRSENR